MALSEEKVSHLSHLILKGIKSTQGVRFLQSDEAVVSELQRLIHAELRHDEEIDKKVRGHLASYSRKIPEGSQEWDILYKRFFEEELKRQRRL